MIYLNKTALFWIAACALLFLMLGSADLWTQEWRWADIIWRMRASGDYLHPHLAGQPYYDKPLLSYWMMLATTRIFGLNEWGLRLPSALAGLLVLFSTRGIGNIIFDSSTAKLAAWLLLTSYFFVFWSRVASADMLNVAGILFALYWYFSKKHTPSFFSYTVFFSILASTCLIKGLIAAAVVFFVVATDLSWTHTWKQQFNNRFLLGLLIGIGLYITPFLLAHQSGSHENSLYLVYRENILRFFSPFDHKDPWYSYFLYLPFYLLPWILVAAFSLTKKRIPWPTLNAQQKAFLISILLLFLFFTLSGSRRSYYILPLVPLCSLWIAKQLRTAHLEKFAARAIIVMYGLLLTWFAYFQPHYYQQHGLKPLAQQIKQQAQHLAPWQNWHAIMIATDDRLGFYLQTATPPLSFRSYHDVQDKKALLKGPVIIITTPEISATFPKEGKIIPPHQHDKFSIWLRSS
ncbi:MAG: glycosyltransferase family 39 protein [Gammaproteobacteria bacterium]|nr:glycosyltransferase family 39 protein [Gammaproteobacteria bacterium]